MITGGSFSPEHELGIVVVGLGLTCDNLEKMQRSIAYPKRNCGRQKVQIELEILRAMV